MMAWITLALSLAFAASPALTDGFAGFEKSQFPVILDHWPVQPVGWAFSIWGLIYLWLVVSGFKGLKNNDSGWQAARPPLIISLLLGTFWIAVANASPVVATVMILAMAAGAIRALFCARGTDAWWLSGPVGLYAGWLTAASGVACAVVLSGHGILGPQAAAFIFLTGVLIVALIVTSKVKTLSYPLAVCWALFGVIVANSSVQYWPVATLAGTGIILIAGIAYYSRNTA